MRALLGPKPNILKPVIDTICEYHYYFCGYYKYHYYNCYYQLKPTHRFSQNSIGHCTLGGAKLWDSCYAITQCLWQKLWYSDFL